MENLKISDNLFTNIRYFIVGNLEEEVSLWCGGGRWGWWKFASGRTKRRNEKRKGACFDSGECM